MKEVVSKSSARRRRSVPVFFWHCTPASRLPGILGRGLVPGGKGWVYLSDCRETAANYCGMFHPERTVVLRIAGAALDEALLGPDDDDLADLLDQRRSGRRWHDLGWRESLAVCSQCTYAGTIPPGAIAVLR
jgi:hypothetical protein